MIPISHSNLILGHQTHAGETGKNNEDRALIRAYKGQTGEAGDITLAVIADGIGGHRAGEVASQIVISTFTQIFDEAEPRAYLDLFTRAFTTAQQSITKHIAANPESEGMGTTCSAAIISNQRLYMAYVGDSRMFLIRNGSLRQITIDHTWVQEAIDHGILTKADAKKHPNRHVVRRHLGAGHDPTPDLRLHLSDSEKPEDSRQNQGLPLNPGDIVLLSSDGMTDLVEEPEILAAFETQTPQQAVDSLVLLARQRGGYDNITVTALMVPPLAAPTVAVRPVRKGVSASTILGIALIVIVSLAVFTTLAVSASFLILNLSFSATDTPVPTLVVAPTLTVAPVPIKSPTPQPAILISPTPVPLTQSPTPTSPVTTGPPTITPTTDLTEVWLTLTAQSELLITPTP